MSNPGLLDAVIPAAAIGSGLGFILQKSAIYKPAVIRGEFEGSDATLLTTGAMAIGVSTVGVTLLKKYVGGIDLATQPLSLASHIGGGALTGAGIYLAGSCPTMVTAQIGAGVPGAWYVYLGGLAGAFTFGRFYESIGTIADATRSAVSSSACTLASALGVPFCYASLGFGLTCIGGAFLLKKVACKDSSCTLSPVAKRWCPVGSGMALGGLQLLANLNGLSGVAASQAFVTIASAIALTARVPVRDFPYLKKYACPHFPENLGPIVVQVSTMIGAFAAKRALSAPAKADEEAPVTKSALAAFLGGFLLVFGARCTQGCPLDHSLGGIARLGLSSFATVGGVALGGVSTALIVKKGLGIDL